MPRSAVPRHRHWLLSPTVENHPPKPGGHRCQPALGPHQSKREGIQTRQQPAPPPPARVPGVCRGLELRRHLDPTTESREVGVPLGGGELCGHQTGNSMVRGIGVSRKFTPAAVSVDVVCSQTPELIWAAGDQVDPLRPQKDHGGQSEQQSEKRSGQHPSQTISFANCHTPRRPALQSDPCQAPGREEDQRKKRQGHHGQTQRRA